MKLAVLSLLLLVGCAEQQVATNQPQPENDDHRILRQQGYKDIVLRGWVPFKCGEDDNAFYTDGFEATAPNGERITGTICGALFKGKTIRLN